jgi:hypothetical protein
MNFLCGGGSQPACPAATSGTITGTIIAANVTGPVAQGIERGDFTTALEAVGDGAPYANFPAEKFVGKSAGATSTRTMAMVIRAMVIKH